MGTLELTDHRVALADAHELTSVVVQGPDPGPLARGALLIGAVDRAELQGDRAVGLGLAQHRPRISLPAIDCERQAHRPVERRRGPGGGSEAELRRRLERERTAGDELQRGQPSNAWATPCSVSIPYCIVGSPSVMTASEKVRPWPSSRATW